jgi:hypothetical protein
MATWRGSTAIQEDPNSPEVAVTQSGVNVVRIFNGQYSVLAGVPIIRGAIYPDGQLDEGNLKKAPGGRGILVMKFVPFSFAGIDSPGGIQEVEWLEVQKKLETHPRYSPGGTAELTEDDLDKIEQWRNAANATERHTAFVALSTNAVDFVTKVARGQDSYVVYAPVARQTLKLTSEPTPQPCGVIQSPPPLIAIGGYQYLKTADRVSGQSTHWEQTREWTGAAFWDSEIYPFG